MTLRDRVVVVKHNGQVLPGIPEENDSFATQVRFYSSGTQPQSERPIPSVTK